MLGDWAIRRLNAKPIAISTKVSCLKLFKQGMGYHKAARVLELRPYTVRDWLKRFKAGDESWATRDGRRIASCIQARNLIQYRHEIETFVQNRGSNSDRDGSCVNSEWSFLRGEVQMDGSAEQTAAVPLYRIDETCTKARVRGIRKKKEIAAVQSLVADGHTIKDACCIAKIPRCAYYRALKPSAKVESDAELVKLMRDVENDKHISSTYGIDRLTGEVNNRLRNINPELKAKILRSGTKINRKRIHRLMKEYGIHSRIRRRKHPDGYYKAVKTTLETNRVPNILKRNFTAERPFSKLTTDVTYIPCSDRKFIYLSALFDLFNHEIVSYTISTTNSEEFIKNMLKALPKDAIKGALIHNDQGAVYWSNEWVKLCEELQIVRSMSRRGNCWDNALSENFFSAMKVDLGLTKQCYKTLLPEKEATDLVNDYIPWYNNDRIQKKLHYLSPVLFREAYLDKSLPGMNANASLYIPNVSHTIDKPQSFMIQLLHQ